MALGNYICANTGKEFMCVYTWICAKKSGENSKIHKRHTFLNKGRKQQKYLKKKKKFMYKILKIINVKIYLIIGRLK